MNEPYIIVADELLKGENGEGVPASGTEHQVLRKIDDVDYNTEWHTLSKTDVGLENVDNTSDLDKPISTATQSAITTLTNDTILALNTKMNLDGSNSNIDELHFDITPTSTDALLEGQLRWNVTDKTLDIGMDGQGVVQQVGMETYYPKCKNTDTVTIHDGELVMFAGSQGNSGVILVKKATTNMALPGLAMGVATETITVNKTGRITWFGLIRGIQTNGVNYGETWVDGTILYNSSTTPGGLSKNKPTAPKAAVMAGIVVNAHGSNGILFIRPQYFPFVSHLSDVNIINPQDKEVLMYNFATKVWENKTIPLPDMTNYYTKEQIDAMVSALYTYKGNVATYADLPMVDNAVGDVYYVVNEDANYAWDGLEWDLIGNLTPLASATNDGLMSASNFTKLSGIEDGANNYVLPADVVQDAMYVHTDNNFSNLESEKLAGIEPNANYYVLPTDVVQDAMYVHTDNNYTDAEALKLAGIEEGATNYIHPSTHPATMIDITDAGNYFTSTEVEGALQEIGLELDGVQEALATIINGGV